MDGKTAISSVPIIRFHKIPGRPLLIEVDGTTVGEFYPSQQFWKEAEKFQWVLENLKMIVRDDTIDTFKFLESIGKEHHGR